MRAVDLEAPEVNAKSFPFDRIPNCRDAIDGDERSRWVREVKSSRGHS